MAATTTLLGLVTPTQGTLTGTWGDTVNYGVSDYLDIAIAGTLSFAGDGAITLANTTGSSSGNSIGATTAQYAIIKVTGTLTTAKIITGPSYSKTYFVVNAATGSTVTFKASGQTGVSIAVGETALVYYNGTDYVKVVGTATAGAAGGSTTQVQYNNAGVLAGITGATTNGTTLTLVAPILGSPFSVGTMPAFTLGGTVSGGGNQINNVVIGTTTPLAGAFTTLSATGTLSGGTSGTAYSFSGSAPATSLTLDSSGNLGVGTSSPSSFDPFANNLVVGTGSGSEGITIYAGSANSSTLSFADGTGPAAYQGYIQYSHATDALGFYVNYSGSPSARMTIDSSGNLGLGVAPSAWSSASRPALQLTNGAALFSRSAATALSQNLFYNSSDASAYIANGYATLYYQTSGQHQWYTAPSNSSGAGATPISFTQAMTLDASGNLGIGTSSFSARFNANLDNATAYANTAPNVANCTAAFTNGSAHTAGGTFVGYQLNISGNSQNRIGYFGAISESTSNQGLALVFGTNTTAGDRSEKMRLDSSGNLGIGTTTITSGAGWTPRLVLADATSPALIVRGPNSQEGSVGVINGMFIDSLGNTTGTNNNIIFRNTSTNSSFTAIERMRIDSSGNLLVGTTDASGTAGIGFKFLPSATYSRTSQVGSTTSNSDTTHEVYSTGASAYRFYVGYGGTVFATSIVITAISDERLKENVRDIDTGLSSIMALKPRRFDWKEGKGQDKKDVAGFIAQEFEDVFPECVNTSKAGADGIEYKNINHETLIPTLVKAIQEQQALITQLTARITALETA